MKKGKKLLLAIVIVLVVLAAGVGGYLGTFYHAEDDAMVLASTGKDVDSNHVDIIMGPKDAEIGFILYPGAKVQCEAYSPLIERISEQGILTVVVHMPGNIAILRKDAADDIIEQYPDVKHWYIGGHSLGGVMAADYACEHPERVEGLILLASYSVSDLTGSKIKVLSIYGSKDQILNIDSYKENYVNLPADTKEIVIEGGNHSQFGKYGFQKGDGVSSISGIEQLNQTAEAIVEFVNE